jgi:hypothetical protein
MGEFRIVNRARPPLGQALSFPRSACRAIAWLEYRLKPRIQRTIEWHVGQPDQLVFHLRDDTRRDTPLCR